MDFQSRRLYKLWDTRGSRWNVIAEKTTKETKVYGAGKCESHVRPLDSIAGSNSRLSPRHMAANMVLE
jgi:hypothetical protein